MHTFKETLPCRTRWKLAFCPNNFNLILFIFWYCYDIRIFSTGRNLYMANSNKGTDRILSESTSTRPFLAVPSSFYKVFSLASIMS
ncbi:hypothetical protein GDO78_002519 [Eleutherodactylus coqui]|uniref:Uncharacterized protein n=1 Tax=Eleutherodactylus coqui TaxID=57060 RepID=A0A8J6K2R1_ELECQ|nr:hypothetical protein GDO78_002519 [Eleutherodactylus coqui]